MLKSILKNQYGLVVPRKTPKFLTLKTNQKTASRTFGSKNLSNNDYEDWPSLNFDQTTDFFKISAQVINDCVDPRTEDQEGAGSAGSKHRAKSARRGSFALKEEHSLPDFGRPSSQYQEMPIDHRVCELQSWTVPYFDTLDPRTDSISASFTYNPSTRKEARMSN